MTVRTEIAGGDVESESSTVALDLGVRPPLSVVAPAFSDLPHLAVLEGRSQIEGYGRWSYLAADPVRKIAVRPSRSNSAGSLDLMADLRAALGDASPFPSDGAPFRGGALGYFSYEAGDRLHRNAVHDTESAPAGYLWAGIYDWVLARDGGTGRTWAFATNRLGRDPEPLIAAIEARLLHPIPPQSIPDVRAVRSNASRPEYAAWVRRVKDYIAAGDCYQANIARRISAQLDGSGLDLFSLLSRRHPAPFSAYLCADGIEVVSLSPELFLHKSGEGVVSRPIKGTRPRHPGRPSDYNGAVELRSSAKDRAENVMIVDVVRNDLGRVCVPGTVNVPRLWTVEAHPSVWQMVSEISGTLNDGITATDLLSACLPPASVTGAPKIRATEIIREIEPDPRGVYCGTIFAAGFDGDFTSSVAIRTVQITDGSLHLHAGGGIVADSDPDSEYDETVHKVRGILGALGLSE